MNKLGINIFKMKVSVITINYNNIQGLKTTIQSVISQSYKDMEYIIVDGGSTDGSVDLLVEYSDKISKCICEPDNGVYNAMNKGVSIASGEYVKWEDCGIITVPNMESKGSMSACPKLTEVEALGESL